MPVVPGTVDPISSEEEVFRVAKEIGFPLIVKAAFGGGGRGMRIVTKQGELADLLDEGRNEAGRAFGNPAQGWARKPASSVSSRLKTTSSIPVRNGP